jgi:hypothetical protein
MPNKNSDLLYALGLAFLVTSTLIIYWSGLNSAFLFDDIPNFESIGRYSSLGSWHDFFIYILQGDSGPLGRPISLASFYLNDQTWTNMNRFDFKYTNLLIHIINGLLLAWLSYLMTNCLSLKNKFIFSLLVASFWLSLPIHTNTVLYAVQRMTELSALFIILGCIAYLKNSFYYSKNLKNNFYLIFLYLLCFLLSILSKENGILLITYTFSIISLQKNTTNNHQHKHSFFNEIIKFFSIALVLYILYVAFSQGHGRLFSVYERFLTETRIIWTYIYHIIIPKFNGTSLLQDDIAISKSIFNPISTFVAIISLLLIIYLVIRNRKKHPILLFGVSWFLGGHLLESTVIQLELYFEHRNYLPAFGLLLIAIYYSEKALKKSLILKYLTIFSLIIILLLNMLSTYNIAQRWRDPVVLLTGWLENHPHSQRIIEGLDSVIGNHIRLETRHKILAMLEETATKQDGSAHLIFRNLNIACKNQNIKFQDLKQALVNLNTKSYTPPLSAFFANFINSWMSNNCTEISTQDMLSFLNGFLQLKNLQKADMSSITSYWLAEVQAKAGNLEQSMFYFDQAYNKNKNLDILLLQVSYLLTAELFNEADEKLKNVNQDICTNWRACMILKLRQSDIDNMHILIQTARQKANNNEQAVHHPASEERS